MSLHSVREHIPFRARPARAGMEVTEGNVTVAVPEQAEAGVGDDVFFNPVQKLNRDLTVAVLRAARAGEHIGTLKEGQQPRVTMQTDQIPKYVIVNSPEFWEYDDIEVRYWGHVDSQDHPNGIYADEVVTSHDEFPVEVPPNSSTSE